MSNTASLREAHLYDEGTAPTLRVDELAAYVTQLTGCGEVRVRGSFLLEYSTEAEWADMARRLATLKVIEANSPWQERQPAQAEVEFERRRLARGDKGPFGVMYEGFGLQMMLREMMVSAGVGTPALQDVHIVLTNRLVATWGDDLRYHLRTIILGTPAIISTAGLVEAPAKPREFYLAQQELGLAGRSEYAVALLKEKFKGRFLDHDDSRLTEVAKGYAMQAICYQLTGEAFCEDPDCRLFNAHWQEEMVRAQTAAREREYCERHEEWLGRLRGGG